MAFKVLLLLGLSVALLQFTEAMPPRSHDLEKSFVEFLQQDKEFGALMKEAKSIGLVGVGQTRHARSAEEDTFSNEGDMAVQGNQEGFFDRAAKFVMEVLQRFLKWINTDN